MGGGSARGPCARGRASGWMRTCRWAPSCCEWHGAWNVVRAAMATTHGNTVNGHNPASCSSWACGNGGQYARGACVAPDVRLSAFLRAPCRLEPPLSRWAWFFALSMHGARRPVQTSGEAAVLEPIVRISLMAAQCHRVGFSLSPVRLAHSLLVIVGVQPACTACTVCTLSLHPSANVRVVASRRIFSVCTGQCAGSQRTGLIGHRSRQNCHIRSAGSTRPSCRSGDARERDRLVHAFVLSTM